MQQEELSSVQQESDSITAEAKDTAVDTATVVSAEVAKAETTGDVNDTAAETPQDAAKTTAPEKKSRKKRESAYHLMLFVNSKSGAIHQMGIGQLAIEIVAAVILVAIIVLSVGWRISAGKASSYELENIKLTAQVEKLTEQVSELQSDNESLETKVSILSETVNTKVEKETEDLAVSTEAHLPNGFPLSSAGSMSVSENDPNFLLFTIGEGANIQATGAGVVIEVSGGEGFSNCVVVDHQNGYKTLYYNDGNVMVKEGDEVILGSVIYVIGEDNTKAGYKIMKDDEQIDPTTMIIIDG